MSHLTSTLQRVWDSAAQLYSFGGCLLWVLTLGISVSAQAQEFTSSKLPIIVIGTSHENIPDEPKVVTSFRIVDNGSGELNLLNGPTNDYDGRAGIERRGSSSQGFDKVGYAIELRTAANADTSASILGMPREEDWVLHGPYSDKTLVRNAFAYTLAGDLMPYAPRVRLVEVVTGGEYRGVYVLTERIKRDNDRVDVARLDANNLAADSLTGGYILKFDKTTGETEDRTGFTLPKADVLGAQPSKILFHYPRPRDIQPAQAQYIKSYVQEFENRLASRNFDDPDAGYLPYVDLSSFVDFLLVNEVTRNVDGYRLSTYFYKDRDDNDPRLHMGPVWDFNLALANADYCEGSSIRGWALDFGTVCPEDFFYAPFWWPRLMESRVFREALIERYDELRVDGGLLSSAQLRGRLDSLVGAVSSDAIKRNFERYPILGEYIWPNSYVESSHADAVTYVRQWLGQRMSWLDGAITKLREDLANEEIVEEVPTVSVGFAPNPGDNAAQLVGTVAADYPLRITWYNSIGQQVTSYTISEAATARVPPAQGIYVFEVQTATGRSLSGRWLNVATP